MNTEGLKFWAILPGESGDSPCNVIGYMRSGPERPFAALVSTWPQERVGRGTDIYIAYDIGPGLEETLISTGCIWGDVYRESGIFDELRAQLKALNDGAQDIEDNFIPAPGLSDEIDREKLFGRLRDLEAQIVYNDFNGSFRGLPAFPRPPLRILEGDERIYGISPDTGRPAIKTSVGFLCRGQIESLEEPVRNLMEKADEIAEKFPETRREHFSPEEIKNRLAEYLEDCNREIENLKRQELSFDHDGFDSAAVASAMQFISSIEAHEKKAFFDPDLQQFCIAVTHRKKADDKTIDYKLSQCDLENMIRLVQYCDKKSSNKQDFGQDRVREIEAVIRNAVSIYEGNDSLLRHAFETSAQRDPEISAWASLPRPDPNLFRVQKYVDHKPARSPA